MGRMRDDLPDHEGYVLAELDRSTLYAEDGWTSSSTPETREATPTGRHRAACDCGWRGPIVETGVADIFLDEAPEDALMEAWEDHTDHLASLAELSKSAKVIARETERIGVLVKAARNNGRSWSEIGNALGLTKQAAQQRWS